MSLPFLDRVRERGRGFLYAIFARPDAVNLFAGAVPLIRAPRNVLGRGLEGHIHLTSAKLSGFWTSPPSHYRIWD